MSRPGPRRDVDGWLTQGNHAIDVTTLLGLSLVFIGIFGGFMLAGGDLGVLVQPSEIVVILGAAAGTFMTSAPGRMRRRVTQALRGTVAAGTPTREHYLQVMKLLYELFLLARRQGLLALEPHAEAPRESELFQRYPIIHAVPGAARFLAEGLIQIVNSVDPDDLDQLLEAELEGLDSQSRMTTGLVKTLGEALPGMGIVAAVLGIIVTMGFLGQSPEVIGHHVAGALIGTFMGILLCYGVLAPLATRAELLATHQRRLLLVIKASLVASARGQAPLNAVEFGRGHIFQDERPSFARLDQATAHLTGGAAAAGDVQPGEMMML